MNVTPTSAVPYYWNNYDRCMAALHGTVTPYNIPAEKLNEAWQYPTNVPVQVPLGATLDPGTVHRFFREGYEWIRVPEGVTSSTILGLLPKLHELDKVRFAHFDPVLVAATATYRNIEHVKRMTHSTLDVANNALASDPTIAIVNQVMAVAKEVGGGAELMPYEDLVRLHLEYWGNSRLRAAFVNRRVPPYPPAKFDIFRAFPFLQAPGQLLAKVAFGVAADLIPQAIMAGTEIDGAKLEWVLARKAVMGVPVRTPGKTGAPGTASAPIKVFSLPPPRIELDGFAVQELRVFHLKEWKTASSKLAFRVTISAPAKKTIIEIAHQGAVIYSETKEGGEFIVPGVHLWHWDGYDSDGVLDTIRMKNDRLEARVTTVDMFGRTAVGRTYLRGGPGAMRWVDARLDRKKKTIECTVYAHFRNPSDVEITGFKVPVSKALGGLLTDTMQAVSGMESSVAPLVPFADKVPEAASLDDLLDSVPLLDMMPLPSLSEMLNKNAATISLHLPGVFDLDDEFFQIFKNDIVYGIGYHWSRDVTLDGAKWELAVSCRERPVDHVPIFLMKGITDVAVDDFKVTRPAAGSGVLGAAQPLDRSVNLSCFGEGLPILDIWDTNDDQDKRRAVGAHELGHSVLREAYDPFTSATHKGTTTVVGGPNAAGSAIGVTRSNPLSNEIDLMYYQGDSGATGHPEYKHHIAVEDDARALVWLSRVVFG